MSNILCATVLYSFFDWPLSAVVGAKLVVVGISNTLNLPQRLSPKLSSRMGQDSMYFGAYNKDEIVTIIKKRLDMTGDICNVSLASTQPLHIVSTHPHILTLTPSSNPFRTSLKQMQLDLQL